MIGIRNVYDTATEKILKYLIKELKTGHYPLLKKLRISLRIQQFKANFIV